MHWSKQTSTSNNTREDSTHGHHQMVNTKIRLIIFFAAKDGEALYNQQKQEYGSDHKIFIAKFRLKLKKIGKTTRPFRYDLSNPLYSRSEKQIQGIRCDRQVPEELWLEVHDIVQEAVQSQTQGKKKFKRQNGCLRRPYK